MKKHTGWFTVAATFLLSFVVTGSCLCAEPLRIATYNLGNYLDTNRWIDGRWSPNYPKPEQEKRALRKVILTVRPDVLALQEIGSLNFLEELRVDLSAGGLDFPYFAHMEAVDSQRHLAVLSRTPIRSVVPHKDLDFKYFGGRESVKRGLLEVDLATGPEPEDSLLLFVVHLKSRLTENKKDPESEKRRVGEATACRNRIIERAMERGRSYFCVTGDFNDHPDSATLRRFLQRGDSVIGRRLPAYDDRGEIWTHFFSRKGIYSTFDGFVVSADLCRLISGEQARIEGDLEASDHRMVYFEADF